MLDGILQRRNQTLILREIIGLMAEVLAECCNLSPGLILNDDTIARRPRIAARSAVAMSDQVVLGCFGV